MKWLRDKHDVAEKLFEKGGKLEKLYPLWEAHDTLLFTPGQVTKGRTHVRDGLDLKRMMITVVIALLPCVLWAMYNTGYQANLYVSQGALPLEGWRTDLYRMLGFEFNPNVVGNMVYGALWFLPVFIVGFAVGGAIEVIFAIIRGHEVNEGFLVTGFLFPLTLPPTIPLWQVAVGIAFGVIIGKEIFGGTGMNVLNPALTSRAFLFFAYPAQISGDKVWIAANTSVDGVSGATYLADMATGESPHMAGTMDGWTDAFFGLIPGSMGETSTLFCLFGAAILIFTQVGSWRTMLGGLLGMVSLGLLLNIVGSETNPMFGVPVHWHLVSGSFAFAIVFMATDPVSSAFTERGKLIYGFSIGVLGLLVRTLNPAYPEGWMLAILFMNMFAPFIDHFVVQANIQRRVERLAV